MITNPAALHALERIEASGYPTTPFGSAAKGRDFATVREALASAEEKDREISALKEENADLWERFDANVRDAERLGYILDMYTATLLTGGKSLCLHIKGDSMEDILNVIDRGRMKHYDEAAF